MRGFRKIYCLLCLCLAAIGVGCDIVIQSQSPTNSGASSNGSPSIGQIDNLGDEVVRSTTTSVVRNCGGGITSTTVSYSSAVENAVEWRVGVQAGVGTTIGNDYLPGGLDLNLVLSGEIAPQLRATNEQSIAHTLQGPPNAIMQYEIQWDITWRNLALSVATPLGTNENVQVRYVANISSQIVDEESLSCDGGGIVVAPTAISTNPPAVVPVNATGCQEEQLGPWYYERVAIEVPPSSGAHYTVSLWWIGRLNFNETNAVHRVNSPSGSGDTEIIFTLPPTIANIEFRDPAGGTAWRLCNRSLEQAQRDADAHSQRLTINKPEVQYWRVNLPDGLSDQDVASLVSCMTPSNFAIPECGSS